MQELSLISQASLYVLLGIMGLICLIIWGWQIRVLKGKAMKNPDCELCVHDHLGFDSRGYDYYGSRSVAFARIIYRVSGRLCLLRFH